MPPPQGTLSCVWQWLLVVVFLGYLVPLRSPSAVGKGPPPGTDCPETRQWPTFCSALLNTSLLNDTARRKVQLAIPTAKAHFCEMVRVLNKIDCAQPFTVTSRWRIGCQEAYRDWSCSLLAEGLLPVGLNSCDSTCHQVIRVCPYLSPDRVQLEASGRSVLHPSQYGGHPAFHCPTTYTDSNHQHTEDYFFRRSRPHLDALVCILFNPSEAGLSYASFPLQSLDLRNFSVTYCQDYGSNHDDPHPLLTDKRGSVNVTQCCWTYNTALPRTYNTLSSTLRRRVDEENCVPPPPDQETLKQVFLQCLVTQETSRRPDDGFILDYEVPFYVDDEGLPPDPFRGESGEDEDPTIDRFNSAEGEDYEDEEYDFPRATSTTEAFLSLIASLDSHTTPQNWRERRSLATQALTGRALSLCPYLLTLFPSICFLLVPLLFGVEERRRESPSRPETSHPSNESKTYSAPVQLSSTPQFSSSISLHRNT